MWLGGALVAPQAVMAKTPLSTAAAPAARKALQALFADDWDWQMAQEPTWASELGDRRFNDRWKDLSETAFSRRKAHWRNALRRLARIDRQILAPADRLDYDLFRSETEIALARATYRWDLVPMSHQEGLQNADELAEQLRFETVKDYEDWLARLNALPVRIDQTMAVMRAGIKARRILPRVIMARVPAQLARQIVKRPEDSPFYAAFRTMPTGIPVATRENLQNRARQAIASRVIPAYTTFAAFFSGEYLPACPEETGLSHLPEGKQLYAFLARMHTTTTLTPDQIHALGLSEVSRLRGEMEKAKQRLGFQGDLPTFFAAMRGDPRYYYPDGPSLLAAYRSLAKRIDPLLVKIFGTLPRTPYGVEPIPEALAADTTTAYYMPPAADGSRAGNFYVNLYKPEVRPRYEMVALALHESVPGHHLQIARAMELTSLPNFRKHGGTTAFIEGWGLYAESLGTEMGLYDDPADAFGQLTYEMWRAVRLVVDTGLHDRGWSRQRAIDYFLANTAKTEHDVTNEVDRYIADPGQALAYKIGELKIKELRVRATTKLGTRFDLRAFHDMLLSEGALPLDLLEVRVNDWIAAQGR